MRLTVLMGGANTERDVSIASGVEVADALREAGHAVAAVDTATAIDADDLDGRFTTDPGATEPEVRFDPPTAEELRALRAARSGRVFAPGVMEACTTADLVVVMVYGDEGESGHVQAVLDWVDVRYTGPEPLACGITFDKDLTKRLLRDAGVPTQPWRLVLREDELTVPDLDLGAGPWVVKPVRGGSTIGTTFAGDRDELRRSLAAAHEHDENALVEPYLPGTEVTVALLGDRPLPVLEIRTDSGMFDYVAKYHAGHAEEICPAPIPDRERDTVQRLALETRAALKMPAHAFIRVDLRADADGDYHVLEVNSVPGMTPTSLYPQCAAAAGMDLPALCDRIVRMTSGT